MITRLTEQDIERNLDNVANDKPLDMPLIVLDGNFKKKYRYETRHCYWKVYQKSKKYKLYKKAYYQKRKRETAK